MVTISGVNPSGYNGTFPITAVPSPTTFQYTIASQLANGGGGTATYFSPFRVRINGNDSAVVGGSGLPYNNANLAAAINAISGFPGTVTVSGAAAPGFTIAYSGASAGLDVSNVEIVNLSCGGCSVSVQETNHGGSFDSFRLNYDGNVSGVITNGTNYTAAALKTAIEALLPSGSTVTVAGFGGATFNNTGFQVTYSGGPLAHTNVPVLLQAQDFTAGASGFTGETDKGGPDRQPGHRHGNGQSPASPDRPGRIHDPTADAVRADRRAQPTRTATRSITPGSRTMRASGPGIPAQQHKTNGPLFAMFNKSAPVSEEDTLLYNSPHENHVTTDPTRVFPDLDQILSNNTNADTGACSGRADRASGPDSGQGVLLRVPADVRLHAERAALPSDGA